MTHKVSGPLQDQEDRLRDCLLLLERAECLSQDGVQENLA